MNFYILLNLKERMRVFIAIDLGPEIKEKVARVIRELEQTGAKATWTKQENLHLTLKFLGDVSQEHVKEIEGRVNMLVQKEKLFSLTLEGLGFFGSQQNPRVIWIGVTSQGVLSLMQELNKALDHLHPETREPKAHLTLGRVKVVNRSLLEKLKEQKDVKIGETNVKDVRLKQSVLTRSGPVYKDVNVFPLEG